MIIDNPLAGINKAFETRKTTHFPTLKPEKLSELTCAQENHCAVKIPQQGKQRTVAIKNVLKSLGSDIQYTSAAELTNLTNKEIATRRKFSSLKPPLH